VVAIEEEMQVVTPEDLESVTPQIRAGDIVIVNTGWHHHYSDSAKYYAHAPSGEVGMWLAAKGSRPSAPTPGAGPPTGHGDRTARAGGVRRPVAMGVSGVRAETGGAS
jgi:hypothetical protein